MKNILILLTVGAAMVGCGQNSVTDAPDAAVKSTEAVQPNGKVQGPELANSAPKVISGFSKKGGIGTLGMGDCPNGFFCMWEHANYQGRWMGITGNSSYVGWMNDLASSFWNRTNSRYCAHQDWFFAGFTDSINAGDSGLTLDVTRQSNTGLHNSNDTWTSLNIC